MDGGIRARGMAFGERGQWRARIGENRGNGVLDAPHTMFCLAAFFVQFGVLFFLLYSSSS